MSNKTTEAFHDIRSRAIGILTDFIKLAEVDERDVLGEIDEVIYEAKQAAGFEVGDE